MRNSRNQTAASASLARPQNLKFERADWSLFRTVEGLQQRAGVAKNKLPRLVLKELADNGLDNGGEVRVGALPVRVLTVDSLLDGTASPSCGCAPPR